MWISHWVDFASCVLMGTFGSCASVSQDLSQWFGKIDAEDTFCPLAPPPLVMLSGHWIMVFRQGSIYDARVELGMQPCGNF